MKNATIRIDLLEDRGLLGMLTDAEAGTVLKALLSLPCDDDAMAERAVMMVYMTIKRKNDKAGSRQAEISDRRRAAAAARWNPEEEPADERVCTEGMQTDANACKPMQMHANACKCTNCMQADANTLEKEKENQKETFPPTPPMKEKEKEKEKDLPPFSRENGPMAESAAQLRRTLSVLLGKYATGSITETELDRLRTQKRNGNLDRLGLRWDETQPEDPPPKRRMPRPTLQEVERYVREKNLNVDAGAFIDFYTANGWKVGGRAPMKDWKAAARNWHRTENKKMPDPAAAFGEREQEAAREWQRMASAPDGVDLSDLEADDGE